MKGGRRSRSRRSRPRSSRTLLSQPQSAHLQRRDEAREGQQKKITKYAPGYAPPKTSTPSAHQRRHRRALTARQTRARGDADRARPGRSRPDPARILAGARGGGPGRAARRRAAARAGWAPTASRWTPPRRCGRVGRAPAAAARCAGLGRDRAGRRGARRRWSWPTPWSGCSASTERLRRDCPWDREQTVATIVPHTVEEAYEVAEAARAGHRRRSCSTSSATCSSRPSSSRSCARRHGAGDLATWPTGITDKLIRRHPHVFGERRGGDGRRGARELGADQARPRRAEAGIFHDVPGSAGAAAMRARCSGGPRRSGSTAHAWDGAWARSGRRARRAREAPTPRRRRGPSTSRPTPRSPHELGDLLFAAMNVARRWNADPELALRAAAGRFRDRRRARRALSAADGEDLAGARPGGAGRLVSGGQGALRG